MRASIWSDRPSRGRWDRADGIRRKLPFRRELFCIRHATLRRYDKPQRRHKGPASAFRKRSAPPPTVRSRNGLSESRTGAGTIRSPEKNALKKAERCNKVQIANQQRFIHMTPEKGLRSYRTKKHRSESIAFRKSRRGPVPARKVGCDPQGRAAYRIRRGACPAEDPGTGRKTSAPTRRRRRERLTVGESSIPWDRGCSCGVRSV